MEKSSKPAKYKAFIGDRVMAYATGRVTYYPTSDGGEEVGCVEVADNLIFARGGWETHDDFFNPLPPRGAHVPSNGEDEPTKYNLDGTDKGRSRARRKIYDLVRCNPDLDTMLTLTLSPDRVDRSDYKEIIGKLRVWLDNRVRRRGLKYFLVAEYHADGENIHFHGLCNSAALDLVYSGHRRSGKRVYNIKDFPLGFTAAVKIGGGEDDRYNVAKYCTKYITKSTAKVGGRYYLHGGDLKTPRVEVKMLDLPVVLTELQAYDGVQSWEYIAYNGAYRKYTIPPQKRGKGEHGA